MGRNFAYFVCVILGVYALAGSASAAPGDLDPGFGDGGAVLPKLPAGSQFEPFAMDIQQDGKLVVVGNYETSTSATIEVARFNTDGTPDSGFADHGFLVVGPEGAPPGSSATDIRVLSDGTILVAGPYVEPGMVAFAGVRMLKLRSNGSLDESFDGPPSNKCSGNGVVCLQFETAMNGRPEAIAPTEGGGFYLAADSYLGASGGKYVIAKLGPDGSLDTAFSTTGVKLFVPPEMTWGSPVGLMVSSDGKLLVAGNTGVGSLEGGTRKFAVTRLNLDGSADATFSDDGSVYYDPSTASTSGKLNDAMLQPDGRIVLVGQNGFSKPSAVLIRLRADGSLDPTFSLDGRVEYKVDKRSTVAGAVGFDSRSNILVGGRYVRGGVSHLLVSRMNSGGNFDKKFGKAGTVALSDPAAQISGALGLIVQSNDRIVGLAAQDLPGVARYSTITHPYLVRLLAFGKGSKPTLSLISPAVSVLNRSALKVFSGRAGPNGLITKVQLALLEKNSALLKKRACMWLRSAKARFKKITARRHKCSRPLYLNAKGTFDWVFQLSKRLPVGSYVLTTRVTLSNGSQRSSKRTFRLTK